jgi:CRP-like cAMP-binding protein
MPTEPLTDPLLLDRIFLLRGLSAAARDLITSHGRLHLCHAEEVIFVGDRRDDVFFICDGSVRILAKTDDGRSIVLADVEAGNMFGELAAIDGLPRSGAAIALTRASLLSLPPDIFNALIGIDGDFAARLIRHMSSVIRTVDRRITTLTLLTPRQRVYRELLRRAAADSNGVWQIQPVPPHRDISGWTGTAEEEVAAAIGDLLTRGLLRYTPDSLIISNKEELGTLARI